MKEPLFLLFCMKNKVPVASGRAGVIDQSEPEICVNADRKFLTTRYKTLTYYYS
jgi:hypothetical protein